MNFRYIFFPALIVFSADSLAQTDTIRKPAIDIISAYKPVLRNAVKINFSGTQLSGDTVRRVSAYKIPSQALFYSYQPVALRPLALDQDTSLYLGMRHFVKAGFGNLNTPYVNAGTSFGDGKTALLNIYGGYISSKGKIENQDYSNMYLNGAGSYFAKQHEVYASAGFSSRVFHLYGYDHNLYDFSKKDIRQKFQEINAHTGLKNTGVNSTGINYNPNLGADFFTLTDRLTETSVRLNIPAERKFGESFSAKVEGNFDYTHYETSNILPDTGFNNTIVQISPSVKYYKPRFFINAGFNPTWDNGDMQWLPDVYFEFQLQERLLMLQGGWVGRITKNTVRNLSYYNPYLQPLRERFNTKETEYYGGIKASLGSHFNFSGKVSWIHYKNFALFVNDTTSVVNSFRVGNEAKMNNFRIHGNVNYINKEKFTATAAFTLNGYTGMETFERAWNTLPLEIRGSVRYLAFKKLTLKGDVYSFAGGKTLLKNVGSYNIKGGTDLSLGAEYKINDQFSAWLDVNNVLNDKYERWPAYQVYGLNLLGGIIIHF